AIGPSGCSRLRHDPAGVPRNRERQSGGRNHRAHHCAARLRNEFQGCLRRRPDLADDRAVGRPLMKRFIFLASLLIATPALADGARIVVPAHDIRRGDTISDSDLTYQTVTDDRPGAVTSLSELSGMQARRFLHAGEPVREDDVKKPVLVTKGSTVTMTFE